MPREHRFVATTTWRAHRSEGTFPHRTYDRDHLSEPDGRPPIEASSDPSFRGAPARCNPELLLAASPSQCHMLWYLHLCATSGTVVRVLRPRVQVAREDMIDRATALHADASARCFIAKSVSFPARHLPQVATA